jgi:hypothetical protein
MLRRPEIKPSMESSCLLSRSDYCPLQLSLSCRVHSVTQSTQHLLRGLGILGHPFPRLLVECRSAVFELVRDTHLNRIIGLRCFESRPDQRKHILDLVRRLPLVGTQHAQAHGTAFVV